MNWKTDCGDCVWPGTASVIQSVLFFWGFFFSKEGKSCRLPALPASPHHTLALPCIFLTCSAVFSRNCNWDFGGRCRRPGKSLCSSFFFSAKTSHRCTWNQRTETCFSPSNRLCPISSADNTSSDCLQHHSCKTNTFIPLRGVTQVQQQTCTEPRKHDLLYALFFWGTMSQPARHKSW